MAACTDRQDRERPLRVSVVSTNKSNILTARSEAEAGKSFVVGSRDVMDRIATDWIGLHSPGEMLGKLHAGTAEKQHIFVFSDQIAGLGQASFYVYVNGIAKSMSAFELLCAEKYCALVDIEGHGETFDVSAEPDTRARLIEALKEHLERAESVANSVASHLAEERLRSRHLQQQLVRVREYYSILMDYAHRGQMPAELAMEQISHLKEIERIARKEFANAR
ncbi:hypothetical protein [[Pseudomonas] boreopolis]|uniref:hypothetical protein n=1 Tax=Xanthomonas boreopolis TaxID=86183 RepID=UPI003D4B0224